LKRVLLDCDVVLDVLLKRQPFVLTSAQVLDAVVTTKIEGYLAGHAVTNIYYILRRQLGRETAYQELSKLLQHLRIVSITDAVIRAALQSAMSDLEDAVASEAAKAAGLDLIVTRNLTAFVASSVPALLPNDLLKMLSE